MADTLTDTRPTVEQITSAPSTIIPPESKPSVANPTDVAGNNLSAVLQRLDRLEQKKGEANNEQNSPQSTSKPQEKERTSRSQNQNKKDNKTIDSNPMQKEGEAKKENEQTKGAKEWLAQRLKAVGEALKKITKSVLRVVTTEKMSLVGAVTLPLSIASGAGPLWIAAGALPHAIGTLNGWVRGTNKGTDREKAFYLLKKAALAGGSALIPTALDTISPGVSEKVYKLVAGVGKGAALIASNTMQAAGSVLEAAAPVVGNTIEAVGTITGGVLQTAGDLIDPENFQKAAEVMGPPNPPFKP